MENKKPRVLLVDIETAPSLGWTWGKWEQNVIAFKEDWYILSFAFKWLGGKGNETGGRGIQFRGLPDYKYSKNSPNDKQLVHELWNLFDKADIIIAHHGDGFDVKKSNARFVFHGLKPPAPYKSVDTLKIARKYFKFDSNRLDDLAQYLGVGKKKPHSGTHTWFGCMTGDKKAWNTMRIYNKHDIVLLEGVYLRLRAWADTHPNLNNFSKNGCCITCQSSKIQKRGINVSKTGYRERFQCCDCGAWFSGVKHFRTVKKE